MDASAAVESQSSETSERHWVAAARSGDTEAFRRIVALYEQRLFTLLIRMVKHYEEAEDLAQEAFVRAWRRLDAYDPERPFRAWLFRIARNLALDALRRPRATIVSIETGGDDEGPAPALATTDVSPVGQAIVREQKRRLARALEELAPRAAMVFTLFYQENMSVAEIAETTDMTPGAVKVALHRTRELLRSKLRETEDHAARHPEPETDRSGHRPKV